MAHLYRVGHTVSLIPSVLRSAAGGEYEVIQLVPDGNDGPQYRIKSKDERHERVVLEREIEAVPAPAEVGGPMERA
jgi:hypothetical protein